jgi:hypothetical protein
MDAGIIIYGLCAAVVSIPLVMAIVRAERAPKTLEDLERKVTQSYFETALAAGLSPEDALQESRLREGFVRLRRRASEMVLADASNAEASVVAAAKEEALRLALAFPQDGRKFVRWVESCPLREILLPEAYAAYERHVRSWKPIGVTAPARTDRDRLDTIAALTKW